MKKKSYIPRHASLEDTHRIILSDIKKLREEEAKKSFNKINIEKPKEININPKINSNRTNVEKTRAINNNNPKINEDFWTGNIPLNKLEEKKNIKKNKKKKNNVFFIVLIIFFLVLIGISGYKILCWFMDNNKTNNKVGSIYDKVEVLEVDDNDKTSLVSKADDLNNPYWYYIRFPLIDVDISKLKKEYSNIVGWINVNNTNINYPFVQTDNNDYYLNHSIDRTYNEAGWLFLDYRNNSNFDNKNSIIYAHSRLDKSMFGSLSKVLKSSWYNDRDNHIIRISLENENTMWQIFSVYKIKTEDYYITTSFNSDEEYLKFLDIIKERSLYDFNTSLGKNDKILTLSTCYSDTERTVVHAKLIKIGKKD